MSQIHITDGQTDQILDVIAAEHILTNKHYKSLKDTLETFHFETFADMSFSNYLGKLHNIIIPDEDGKYIEFVIFETNKYRNEDGVLITEVYSSASHQLLKKSKVIEPQLLSGQTSSQVVDFALYNTEWQPGVITYKGIKDFEVNEYTNPYSFLKRVANDFDLELQFRVEVDGNKVSGRFVDLVPQVGEWPGREIEFGKDLRGVRRIEEMDGVVTALIGIGPAREDGTRLEALVEDREALERWGRNGQHLIETYEPESTNEDMTLARLTELTENELQNRVNAVVEYKCDIADLESFPDMANKKIRCGDTIKIKDTKFNPPLYLEARVHTQERDIIDKSEKTIELGDFQEYTEAEVLSVWKQLQSQIQSRISLAQLQDYAYDKVTVDNKDELVRTETESYANSVSNEAEQAAITYTNKTIEPIVVSIDSLENDVSNVESDLDDAKGQLLQAQSQISQTQDQIQFKVNSTYVKGAIADIAIGGRNLLLDSTFKRKLEGQNTWSISDNGTTTLYKSGESDKPNSPIFQYKLSSKNDVLWMNFGMPIDISSYIGEELVVSFDFRIDVLGSEDTIFTVRTYDTPNGHLNEADSSLVEKFNITLSDLKPVEGEWQRLTRVIKPANTNGKYLCVAPYSQGDGAYSFREVKIEKGNKASNWSPAPEDFDRKIDGVVADLTGDINVLAGYIDLKADAKMVSDIEARVSSAEVNINGIDSQIELKADSTVVDEIQTRVNSAELVLDGLHSEIKLKADLVDLEAYVTANELEVRGDLKFGGELTGATGTFSGEVTGGSFIASSGQNGRVEINENGWLVKDNQGRPRIGITTSEQTWSVAQPAAIQFLNDSGQNVGYVGMYSNQNRMSFFSEYDMTITAPTIDIGGERVEFRGSLNAYNHFRIHSSALRFQFQEGSYLAERRSFIAGISIGRTDSENAGGIQFRNYNTTGTGWYSLDERRHTGVDIVTRNRGSFTTALRIEPNGNLYAAGSKSGMVQTDSYGIRALYAYEGTRNWFFDIISEVLGPGENFITINPIFLETITDQYFVKAFTQNCCNVQVINRESNGFWVRTETEEEIAEVIFEVYGLRRGYEDVYMEEINLD
ncbi:hypothetical protein MM221_16115 [Salipaludibacillus sp. LMS25]|uniref:phage tail spike protein n=1 Tax=Salipaludibacillus sp. LMS25 TaxID=2924031 RepID=UPI0020D08619|nr:phage tail spike protein [Salipaludibacillus sp. LMS25]UTR14094.1 hypothetical protein MM221_16115 [Salipaludibacillus sp. LMS25]